MPNTRAVVSLQSVTGIPEDVVQNTFHFTGAAGDDADLVADLALFYNIVPSGAAGSIANYMSRAINRDPLVHEVALYTVPAVRGPLGSPRFIGQFTLNDTDAAAVSFPSEVGVTLSYNAALAGILEESGNTRPRARRRGRIYIGPVNTNTSDIIAGQRLEPHVNANARQAFVGAADEVLGTIAAADGWTWSVFSDADWVFRPVVRAWVDDAYDVQRRRGHDALTRTEVTIP